MNKDNALFYIPLIQALAAGEAIETNANVNAPRSPPLWRELKNVEITFSHAPSAYRIKPKERWVNLYMDEERGSVSGSVIHPSEAIARQSAGGLGGLIYLKTIQLD